MTAPETPDSSDEDFWGDRLPSGWVRATYQRDRRTMVIRGGGTIPLYGSLYELLRVDPEVPDGEAYVVRLDLRGVTEQRDDRLKAGAIKVQSLLDPRRQRLILVLADADADADDQTSGMVVAQMIASRLMLVGFLAVAVRDEGDCELLEKACLRILELEEQLRDAHGEGADVQFDLPVPGGTVGLVSGK